MENGGPKNSKVYFDLPCLEVPATGTGCLCCTKFPLIIEGRLSVCGAGAVNAPVTGHDMTEREW